MIVSKVEIDTNHFKGNYPDRASLEGCLAPGATLERLAHGVVVDDAARDEARRPTSGTTFPASSCSPIGAVSHVRLNIFPDGGVSRLRIHGTPART